MPAARYWRAVGLSAYGGGDVELSALQLYEGEAVDSFFEDVSLLLHFDGGLIDSSSRQRSVTAFGGAQVSADRARFGVSSVRFNGLDGFLSTPLTGDLLLSDKSFTVQFWVFPVGRNAFYPVLFENGLYSASYLGLYMGHAVDPTRYQVAIGSSGFPNIQSVSQIVYNQWSHVALERDGSVFRLFVNGALEGSFSSAVNLIGDSNLRIGGSTAGSAATNCFVDDFRVTTHVARGALVPSAPFPNSAISVQVRVDDAAALSGQVAPISGSFAALQDGDAATKVRLAAREPGFALVWDFGDGVAKDVSGVAIGAAESVALFLSHFDLQRSDDGVNWSQVAVLGRFGWPGTGALLPPGASWLPLLPRVGGGSVKLAAGAEGAGGLSVRKSVLSVARDVECGGAGRIYGTTKTKGSPSNLPTKARVVLLHQRSKLPVRETWSDPVTGAFAFTGIDTTQQFLTLAEDAAGNFRPVAANRLTPEVLP